MELRHLRYFVTLAEELHFGHAAEKLHIAQPPLSQQIRQLETELGFQLFQRTKRSVQLTEAGQVFLLEVKKIFKQLEQAIQIGRQTSRGEMGQLVLGFVSSSAYSILPEILRRFRAEFPGVKLELNELATDEQWQFLRGGRIDVGFLRPGFSHHLIEEAIFETETIFCEALVIALPEGHRLTSKAEIPIKSLIDEQFILFPRSFSPGHYDTIISLCQQAGFSPKIIQEAIQMQTIVSLVAAQMGVAIVPSSLQNLQRTGVIYKPIKPTKELAIEVKLNVIWRRNNTSPTVEKFLNVVREVGNSSI
ncbi:LysR family transcriptional regulator [Brunnivagina elsteri]|uniref:LysR family transcriptional regulator n=1 Tax=Brunnivagina elsteri CCALA 953 TaxID=987040 RepID=A0A2A2TIB7_9CYAN|nr:LysR family transcriptional regulator [Calothrix elsteri]PAX53149.1 LysR family transcriptional regulator [Calothrix elsteri CCALA 953]